MHDIKKALHTLKHTTPLPKKRKKRKRKTTQRTEALSTELSETENSPTLLITAKKTKNQNKISRLLANTRSRKQNKRLWGMTYLCHLFNNAGTYD